ncbi:MAG: hypothetical protein LBO00_08090 [Zoogloeaceae bacterium]|nr:hypothetical protein [Zoogloeaceae bacterium]
MRKSFGSALSSIRRSALLCLLLLSGSLSIPPAFANASESGRGGEGQQGEAFVAFVSAEEQEAWFAVQQERLASGTASESAVSAPQIRLAEAEAGEITGIAGAHLVLLWHGRLYTIRIAGQALEPAYVTNLGTPDATGRTAYERLFVSGDTAVVIGNDVALGGTAIVRFRINAEGGIAHQSTHVLRDTPLAVRQIGEQLVFYTQSNVDFHAEAATLRPALRRVGENTVFAPIAASTAYRLREDSDPAHLARHTVQVCDIHAANLDCAATSVLAPASQDFHLASDAVYFWSPADGNVSSNPDDAEDAERPETANNASTEPLPSAGEQTPSAEQQKPPAGQLPSAGQWLFRVPFAMRAKPEGLALQGTPIDHFSFLARDGFLHVLLRMTTTEGAAETGTLALLRLPLATFADARTARYQPLPTPEGGEEIQNRYIGDFLVYALGNPWLEMGAALSNVVYVADWRQPERVAQRALPHGIDRIEHTGNAPLLLGAEGDDLHFTRLEIAGNASDGETLAIGLADNLRLANAARSNIRVRDLVPAAGSGNEGILGLPFTTGSPQGQATRANGSGSIIYLRDTDRQLRELGFLFALPDPRENDNCQHSCADWYGNTQPLFLQGRIFALLGYELIEGRLVGERLVELRRIHFLPR